MKNVNRVEQGADRYVIGHIAPYDQKNEMFKRPFWDPDMMALGQKFYFKSVMPKDRPGFLFIKCLHMLQT